MFNAAESALSSFTQAEYEVIDFLDVPFSAVAPSIPVARRHKYITLDRLVRLGATPGCKACKFDAVAQTPACKARFDGLRRLQRESQAETRHRLMLSALILRRSLPRQPPKVIRKLLSARAPLLAPVLQLVLWFSLQRTKF